MTLVRAGYTIIATAVVLCGKAARVTNSSNRVSPPAHSARMFGVWRTNVGHAYRGRISRLPKANLCVSCLRPDYDPMGKYFASCRLEVLPSLFSRSLCTVPVAPLKTAETAGLNGGLERFLLDDQRTFNSLNTSRFLRPRPR